MCVSMEENRKQIVLIYQNAIERKEKEKHSKEGYEIYHQN